MVPTSAVKLALDFGQIVVAQVRKANNDADEHEEHGDLRVHGSVSCADILVPSYPAYSQ